MISPILINTQQNTGFTRLPGASPNNRKMMLVLSELRPDRITPDGVEISRYPVEKRGQAFA
jgi:hypothetical protein